jgi:imidazolonepropionase-like amidohydrolase
MFCEGATRNTHFVDAHVHIKDARGLDAVSAAGVAAVRDAGVRENSSAGVGLRTVPKTGPTVVGAQWAIYKKGGYGSSLGVAVNSREEISAEIIRLVNAGAAIIKVMASGIVSLHEPGRITDGGFTEQELRYIVQEAAQAGLRVMAHANGNRAIVAAARAGVRSIEHGFFMDREALEVLALQGTYWTPTVGALARAAEGETVPREVKEHVRGLLRSHLEAIRQAYSAGVPLAIGTDCVLPHRDYEAAYKSELAYFEQAGLSRADVMRIAEEGGKKLLGLV